MQNAATGGNGDQFGEVSAAGGYGIRVDVEAATGTFALSNSGLVSGGLGSFLSMGAAQDRILNSGTLQGDVFLGAGNDRIDSLQGRIVGDISAATAMMSSACPGRAIEVVENRHRRARPGGKHRDLVLDDNRRTCACWGRPMCAPMAMTARMS